MDENISWFTQAPKINYFLAFSREKKSFEGSITPKVSLQIWVNLGVGKERRHNFSAPHEKLILVACWHNK